MWIIEVLGYLKDESQPLRSFRDYHRSLAIKHEFRIQLDAQIVHFTDSCQNSSANIVVKYNRTLRTMECDYVAFCNTDDELVFRTP